LKYHRLKRGGVSGRIEGVLASCKIEVPPAKARWGLGTNRWGSLLAVKLKYHRLKRGGVSGRIEGVLASCKIEVPPAKARWGHVWVDKPQS